MTQLQQIFNHFGIEAQKMKLIEEKYREYKINEKFV